MKNSNAIITLINSSTFIPMDGRLGDEHGKATIQKSLILHFFGFVRSYLLDIEMMTELPQFLVKMFSWGVNEQNTVTTFITTITAGIGKLGGEVGAIITLT